LTKFIGDVQYTRIVVLARKVDPEDPRIQDILAKSNMANLKKEAEVAKFSTSKGKRTPQERDLIFLDDEESEYIERNSKKSKKVKPLTEVIKLIQNTKERFEEIDDDDLLKLKKFDFASCKLLARDYQIMMFSTYFERLFNKKEHSNKQLGFLALKDNNCPGIYEEIDESRKVLSSSVSSLLRWGDQSLSLFKRPLNLFKAVSSSSVPQTNTIVYNTKDRNLCDLIGKQFEKKFQRNMEIEEEIKSIFSQNSGPNNLLPTQNLDSLLLTNYTRVENNSNFLEQVEKRFSKNLTFLNDEDKQRKQRDQAQLARVLVSQPSKNIENVLSKHSKLPERKGFLEKMAINEDIVIKEIQPLIKPNTPIVNSPFFNYITKVTPREELYRAFETRNSYYFNSSHL